jgi:hypothetical protein
VEHHRKVTFMQRAIRRLAASAAAGVGIAGIGLLALGSSGVASATNTPAGPWAVTTATVKVLSQLTLTDNNPSIQFGTPASLPGVATTNPTVNIAVSSNDHAGYVVELAAAPNATDPTHGTAPLGFVGTTGNTNTIPFSGLSVTGSGATAHSQTFTEIDASGGFTPSLPFQGVAVDESSTVPSQGAGDAYTDTFTLNIPNVVPDTYTAYLEYIATGN